MKFKDEHRNNVADAMQGAGLSSKHSGRVVKLLEAILAKGPEIAATLEMLIELVAGKQAAKPTTPAETAKK